MKSRILLVCMMSVCCIVLHGQDYVTRKVLVSEGALKLATAASEIAGKSQKQVSVAVLDASGIPLLLLKGDGVGPHNTEASRRKAYTAVSTKSATWDLMKRAAADETSANLTTLPELLLLGGGVPVWADGELIGSLGVSGGGGSLADHEIAVKAIESVGYQTSK